MNILLVNDVSIILEGEELVVLKVMGEDTKVFKAESPAKAIEIVKENDIDIAIIDVELARENNIETSKKISEIKPDIKIIITSGDENYEAEAMAAGASYFISMPVTARSIRAASSILNPKRHERSLKVCAAVTE